MIQVDTGCKTIFRFDNVMPDYVCDAITSFMIDLKGEFKSPDLSVMPWHNDDSYDWKRISSNYLFGRIEAFRDTVTDLVSSSYGEQVYPNFTDIVLWRAGRSMNRHKDNGYTEDDQLRARAYTVISYMNDNYEGGETFIKSENGDYISTPKKGTIVILRSDEENEHGVNIVKSGIRVTLPMWFTTDVTKMEMYNLRR